MDKYIIYFIFVIFNFICAVSGISILGSGIYLFIKTGFNQYIIIIIGFGLIMALVSVIGFFSKKRPGLLILYMILILIIFLVEIAVTIIINFYVDINEIIEVDEEKKEDIIKILTIGLLSAAGCCLISFLCAIFYYRKLKEKERKYMEEISKQDDILKGLDYTNLSRNMSAVSN